MSSFEKGDGEAVPPPFPADSVKVCGWQKLRRSRSAVCIVLFLSGKGLSPCVEKFPGGSARINVSEQGGTEYGGIGLQPGGNCVQLLRAVQAEAQSQRQGKASRARRSVSSICGGRPSRTPVVPMTETT